MKMSLIGATLLVIVLAFLYMITNGSDPVETDPNGNPVPVVVDQEATPPDAGNKNFNF
jgi:hypothetical protein